MGDKNELTRAVFKTLPDWIMAIFGDPISKVSGGLALLSEGFEYHAKKNRELWDSYSETMKNLELIDSVIKSAEYIQFIREVVKVVAYETREEKRKYLLNLAKNYSLKYDRYPFDKKMLFLNILDSLSEIELLFLLEFYGKRELESIVWQGISRDDLRQKLAGLGLISQDNDGLQKALDKLGEESEKMVKSMNAAFDRLLDYYKQDPTRRHSFSHPEFREIKTYDPHRDRIRLEYSPTDLGSEFIDFITAKEDETEKKEIASLNKYF